MKKLILSAIITLSLMVLLVFNFHASNESTSDVNNSNKIDTIDTTAKKDKVILTVFENKTLFSNDKVEVIEINWDEIVPADSRFILVSNNQVLTQNQKMILKDLLSEKKVILFFGDKVTEEDVRKKLDVDFPDIDLMATKDVVYPLFGYGYSTIENKDLPLFLGTSPSVTENILKRSKYIVEFLYEYHDEF